MKPALLICINSLRSGGAERVVSQLLNHLQREFDIHLALYSHIVEYDIPEGIKIFDLNQSEQDGQIALLLKLPYLSYKVSKYCKEHNIQYSVAFLNRPCYINALMKSWWGYKGRVVMCERTHETTMLQTKSAITRLITKKLISLSYNLADLVLANSHAIKEDLQKNLSVRTPINVIYNPVDIQELQIRMQENVDIDLDDDNFYFSAVGNFRKEKNFPLLVDAFAYLKGKACRLLLIGDGPDAGIMKQKISEYGIESQVVFCGRDKNPFRYMHRSDAFVLCSDVEGFPNVLLEALACGKAVISTDCRSGPREMLAPSTDPAFQLKDRFSEEEFGILSPVGDAKTLAMSMEMLITDRDMRNRLQQKAAKRAADFDVSVIKQHFAKAFVG